MTPAAAVVHMLEKAFLVASDGELQPTICLNTLDKRCSISIFFAVGLYYLC